MTSVTAKPELRIDVNFALCSSASGFHLFAEFHICGTSRLREECLNVTRRHGQRLICSTQSVGLVDKLGANLTTPRISFA